LHILNGVHMPLVVSSFLSNTDPCSDRDRKNEVTKVLKTGSGASLSFA